MSVKITTSGGAIEVICSITILKMIACELSQGRSVPIIRITYGMDHKGEGDKPNESTILVIGSLQQFKDILLRMSELKNKGFIKITV